MGDVHTNTIEGFWSLVKRGIGGVYHQCPKKYLQTYLDEYSFRYNRRDLGNLIFPSLNRVSAVADAPLVSRIVVPPLMTPEAAFQRGRLAKAANNLRYRVGLIAFGLAAHRAIGPFPPGSVSSLPR